MKERKNRTKREAHPLLRFSLSLLAIVLLLFVGITVVKFCLGLFMTGDYIVSFPWGSSPIIQEALRPNSGGKNPGNAEAENEQPITYATVSVAGDIMTHMPVVRSGAKDGGYDYSYMFSYLSPYLENSDYAVANLEATLSGTDHGNEYTGSPNFNAPDAFADSAKAVGFDLLLTGNEHCNDYGTYGMKRTLDILKNRGLDTLGTTSVAGDKKYIIKDLNGIQVGMICYTHADTSTGRGTPTVNNNTLDANAEGLLNAFDYKKLDAFYEEMAGHIAAMKEDGAEAIVLYIHWGEEYSLSPSKKQTAIAQKMCDLGVDVIAGGHTHTVQPVELLTSTVNDTHTTVCMYSVGNLVSNQRHDDSAMPSGHTEDGMLFSFTFAKYEDGAVYLDSIDLLPIWVMMKGSGSSRTYQVLPLDSDLNWRTVFQLTTDDQQDAQASYSRTSELVNISRKAVETALEEARTARAEAYGLTA